MEELKKIPTDGTIHTEADMPELKKVEPLPVPTTKKYRFNPFRWLWNKVLKTAKKLAIAMFIFGLLHLFMVPEKDLLVFLEQCIMYIFEALVIGWNFAKGLFTDLIHMEWEASLDTLRVAIADYLQFCAKVSQWLYNHFAG